MAIARVQDIVSQVEAASDTCTATFLATPTQGNFLIAWVRANVVIASFNPPSGWLLATSAIWSAAGSSAFAIYYKVAGASEATAVTFSATAATTVTVGIEEWSGLTPDVNAILDKTAKTDNSGTTTSRSTNTTATTTTANELCVAAVAQAAAVTSPSWSNSFVAQLTLTNLQGATLVVSATGAYETTESWTTSRNAGGCIATFKASPVPIIMNQYRQRNNN